MIDNDCGIVNERDMIFELRLDAQKEDFLLCRNILLDIRAIVEKNLLLSLNFPYVIFVQIN